MECTLELPDVSYATSLPWAEIHTVLGDGKPDPGKRVIVLYDEPASDGTVTATARYF
jgi:hypothetical protein